MKLHYEEFVLVTLQDKRKEEGFVPVAPNETKNCTRKVTLEKVLEKVTL